MLKHWSSWLIVGGLGLDLIDAFTTKAGATGGAIYGPGGFLNSIDSQIPSIHIGEIAAMVGVAVHLASHQPA
jgi:hypothetical protein